MHHLMKNFVLMLFVLASLSTLAFAGKQVSGKLNINTATEKELTQLPFIGEKKAKAIIELRKQKPLQSLEEIEKVRGVSKKIITALEPHVKFSGDSDLKVVSKSKEQTSRK